MKSLTILLSFLIAGSSPAQKNERPHVVIIMADQLRFDVLGEHTPNISALRGEGVSFTRAYVASPICVPSRASFFTGMYPNCTGAVINAWAEQDAEYGLVKKGIPNLYTVMGKEWDSWHVGKQHFFTAEKIDEDPAGETRWITQAHYNKWVKARGAARPGGRAFRAMVPEMISGKHTHTRTYSIPVTARYDDGVENFLDHYIGNESVRAIRERRKDKPLLLNAMFLAPHPPFHIPDPYYSMVSEESVDLPENVGQWYPAQSPLQLYNLTGFLGTRYSREEWRAVWAKYLGLVRLLDDEVGRIIQALKDEGIYDETLIVFTADHGEMLGSHSLWQKMCMYEESVRVPLVMKFPSAFRPAVQETDLPVSLVDVFPTLLEYAGLPQQKDLDGHSLLPLVRGQRTSRTPVFIQYDGNGSLGNFQRCLVVEDHKLIIDIFKDEIFVELYDVVSDPQEKVNLAFAPEQRDRIVGMVEVLDRYMRNTGDRLTLPGNLYERFLNDYQKIIEK